MIFGNIIGGISISPDDKTIAVGGDGRDIKIFDL
jgi:hypothetical protein